MRQEQVESKVILKLIVCVVTIWIQIALPWFVFTYYTSVLKTKRWQKSLVTINLCSYRNSKLNFKQVY